MPRMPDSQDVQTVPLSTQVSQSPSRRDVLRMGAGLFAASVLPRIVVAQQPARDWVNDTLRHLEKQDIPGIGAKSMHLREGAAYGLIHIRQYHYAPETDDAMMSAVEACQRDIYETLQYLIEEPRIRLQALYQEGLVAGGDIPAQEMPSNLKHFQDSKKADIENRKLPEIVHRGADSLLRDQGKLRLKPAERYAEAVQSWKTNLGAADSRENIFEKRENVVLQFMMEGGERLACTVYGAAHDWRNNVTSHNEAHPEQAISLLTLTPKSVRKLEEPALVLNPQ